MNCRCFYSSTDVSGPDPLLIELLIAPDYVPYRTSFAVSHGCEILHSEFQRCFICDSMWRVGFAKKDFSSFGRDFENKLPKRYRITMRAKWASLSSPVRSRLILHMWHEWRESQSEPSCVGRNSPGTKEEGDHTSDTESIQKLGWEIILHGVSTEGANFGEVLHNPDEQHRWLNQWSSLTFRWQTPSKKTNILTQSINTTGCLHVRCAAFCTALQTNTVSIPAVSYLCCRKSQPVGTAYPCCRHRPEWTNAVQQCRQKVT